MKEHIANVDMDDFTLAVYRLSVPGGWMYFGTHYHHKGYRVVVPLGFVPRPAKNREDEET